jgi:beta-lactamase class A
MVKVSTRRALVSVSTLALWAAGCSSTPTMPDPAEPLPPVQEFIPALEHRRDAHVGLFAVDLGSGRTVEYRADDTFAMCSTFKASPLPACCNAANTVTCT